MKTKKLNLLIRSSVASEKLSLCLYSLFIIISTVLLTICIGIVLPLQNNIEEKINKHILNREITVSFTEEVSEKEIDEKVAEIEKMSDVEYIYQVPFSPDVNEQSGLLFDNYKLSFIHKGFTPVITSGRSIEDTEIGVCLIPDEFKDFNEEKSRIDTIIGKSLIGKSLKFSDIRGNAYNVKVVGCYNSTDPMFDKNQILLSRTELLKYNEKTSTDKCYIAVVKLGASVDRVLEKIDKIATAFHFPMNVDVNSYNVTLYILIAGASVLTLLIIFGFYIFLKSNIDRKTTELALYRSLGYTSANIFYIVFVEHFITGVLSLIIGLISAEVINSFLVNPYIHNLLANTFMDMSVHTGVYQIISFAFVFIIVLLFTSKKAVKRSEKIDLTILLRS